MFKLLFETFKEKLRDMENRFLKGSTYDFQKEELKRMGKGNF